MTQLTIRETAEGAFLSVKARPGSRKNEIRGVHDGRLIVSVTAVAEKGRANEAIIKLLAKHFGIAKCRLSIVSGATAATKSVLVEDFTGAQLLAHFSDPS